MIWNIADILTGLYKPHEYGKVILPMTIIKRFNDALEPTKDAVLHTLESVKHLQVKDGFLKKAAGYDFYNISPFTLTNLLNDPEHIEDNFRSFLHGFSDNIQNVFDNFKFEQEITQMANNNKLFFVIQEFNKQSSYMGPDQISNIDMGYIFEELVRKFSESYAEDAGQHFTSRDIIYLMTDLLLSGDKESLAEEGVVKTVYDMAMGTSQMLTCMEERLREIDKDAEISTFGQEINPETFAIAKSDTIIKGGNSEHMRKGNTLSEDKFEGYTFDYIISNPPFGRKWNAEAAAVTREQKRGDQGRFAPGLPSKSDGQMLFTLNGIKKLKSTGKMAIIQNGSSLFTGDAGSGPSEIRRYIIENDMLEAIIQLSNDAFYNTGITTYIWIISKEKSVERAGRVQLIDASNMYVKRRKSIGSKRNDITDQCRDIIIQAYTEFEDKVYESGERTVESKIFDNEDFGYWKVTVDTYIPDKDGNIVVKKGKPVIDKPKRDTENIPLKEDIKEYLNREVRPYNSHYFVEDNNTKIGYEIPFTRHFYNYVAPEKADDIAVRISELEGEISESLKSLLGKVGDVSE